MDASIRQLLAGYLARLLAAPPSARLAGAVNGVKELTAVRKLREQRSQRLFASPNGFGQCRGVFCSFQEARASAPPRAQVGFDHPEFAGEFGERFERIYPHDYPVLFWLRRALGPGCRVFDLGGHTGSQFQAYRTYLEYPPGLSWTVCEVPAVVRRGRALAEKNRDRELVFTESFEEADGCDVLIAGGSLQYVEGPPLAERLRSLAAPPMHLLLNKLPLYDGPPYITLQNGGPVFVPQHVFNRQALLSDLEADGYQLIDSWEVPGFSTEIPFRRDRSVPRFSGLYLRRS